MNAYELADIIEDDMEDGFGMGFLKDAVSMLRQQQAEIEALKSLFRQLKIEPNLPDAWRKLGEMLDE